MRTHTWMAGVFGTVIIASLVHAGGCLYDHTRKCCQTVEFPPQNRPACASEPWGTSCNDIPIKNPDIPYVMTGAAGRKGQVITPPSQTCKYQVRKCNAEGFCVTIGPVEYNCYPSELDELTQAYP